MSFEDKGISPRRNVNSKEVEKYIKFFVLKALQAVVSSRTGIHNKTKCNPSAKGQDWFNISLHESEANRRLQSKIRELFGKRIPSIVSPICLDIVLKTFEGSYIILETWQLSTESTEKDTNYKNHFSIYNRLGVLLKSFITISRVLPSFNLAKKNEKDFSLYFKVHSECYQLHQYEMHNSVLIGNIKTPIGLLNAKVMYRNKIWLSGSFHAHTYTMNDDFDNTLIPLSYEKEIRSKTSFQSIDMFENELALAVSETHQEWINSPTSKSLPIKANLDVRPKQNDNLHALVSIGPESGLRQVAAFAEPLDGTELTMNILDLPKLPPTPPFESLLQEPPIQIRNDKSDETDSHEKDRNKSKETFVPRHAEAVGFEDDFVLVELRPAFFSEDDSVGNLYKQCQSPVPLEIFATLEQEDEQSESMDIDTQLEKYRRDLQEYQQFFNESLN